ncbi:MAG: hypothetical protein LQ345_006976, partial [Seirophora villosa]
MSHHTIRPRTATQNPNPTPQHMDADNQRFFQEASQVQVEHSRFLQQQSATIKSPSPQVKREPSPKSIPADDNDVADTATSPKCPSRESPHKHRIAKTAATPYPTTAAQKENRQPSDTLAFRAVNWKSRPLPSPPPLHRQSVSSSSNANPLHTHPNLSFPPRSRHKSTPLPLIKTEPEEHSDDNDNPTPTTAAARPLTARRTTISASDCKEENRKERLRRKREWKQELELRED